MDSRGEPFDGADSPVQHHDKFFTGPCRRWWGGRAGSPSGPCSRCADGSRRRCGTFPGTAARGAGCVDHPVTSQRCFRRSSGSLGRTASPGERPHWSAPALRACAAPEPLREVGPLAQLGIRHQWCRADVPCKRRRPASWTASVTPPVTRTPVEGRAGYVVDEKGRASPGTKKASTRVPTEYRTECACENRNLRSYACGGPACRGISSRRITSTTSALLGPAPLPAADPKSRRGDVSRSRWSQCRCPCPPGLVTECLMALVMRWRETMSENRRLRARMDSMEVLPSALRRSK